MKIQLLTSIKGRQMWERGAILSSPFPPDIQSLVNDTRVIRILELDPIIPKVEEKAKAEEDTSVKEVKEVKEKVVPPKVAGKKVVLKKRG